MSDNIVIEGIETNNLKNIDVQIVKKGVNLIIGPSGSGNPHWLTIPLRKLASMNLWPCLLMK